MNTILSLLVYLIKKLIDWIFRTPSTPRYLIRIGVTLSAPSAFVWVVTANFQLEDTPLNLVLSYGEAGSRILFYLGALAITFGILFEIFAHYQEIRRANKRRISVIEVRGLRGVTGAPLVDAVPKNIKGVRDPMLVSLKLRDDGQIDPAPALREISSVVTTLNQRESGLDRADLIRVFGGLAPVPYLFLAGVMLDNEQNLKIMDWDRDQLKWRELDGLDDQRRFSPSCVHDLPCNTIEVILAVSASFKVDIQGATQAVGDLPVIELELDHRSLTSHWSEDKQVALAATFRETVRILTDKGVKKIHLFLAAPASLSFRLGANYDKRLSPETTIYQYERKDTPPFPWGISLPVGGKEEATIVTLLNSLQQH